MIDIEAMPYLADIPRVQAERRPDAAAFWFEGRTTTYAEFEKRSNQVANGLLALGIQPGDRIGYLAKNTDVYYEMMFGAAKARAVMNGVNTRLAAPEVKFILSDANAKVLFVGKEFYAMIDQIKAELPDLKRIITIDGDREDWDFYPSWRDSKKAGNPGLKVDGDDDVIQLYTSGTTGLPKGVMLTNDNFFSGVIGISEQWRFTEDSVNLAMMPMFHIAGAGWAAVGLYHGCRTVVLRDIDPAAVLAAIPTYGVTNAFMVPAVIQFLLMTPGVETTDFSTLRALVYGASPITDKVLVQGMETFGCEFIQVYGLTETTGAITQLDGVDHDPANRPDLLRSCGKPYPWVEMRVVEATTGEDRPVGEVGELWTRSHQNMAGYWNNPAATAEAMTPDGWFRTGDAGYLDADGYVYLHDRVKDMIVSGGENVYPAEVENVVARHPDVADVAVIGVPDERWGEAVKAIVVPAESATAGPDLEAGIIAYARDNLAGYKLPKSVDFAEVLPRNPSGKLLKRELREPYWAGRDRQVG
jgi:long-chain acyl-CoA synthetase